MKKPLIEAVKKHAIDNYNKGWDVVAECWTDEEIEEELGEAKTPKEAIKVIGEIVGVYDSHRREIEATRW